MSCPRIASRPSAIVPPLRPHRRAELARVRGARLVPLLLLVAATACGGGHDASEAAGEVECARVDAPRLALAIDRDCVVASHELAHRFLPDLTFTPGLCYSTGSVPVQIVGADGRAIDLEVTAFSGIDR